MLVSTQSLVKTFRSDFSLGPIDFIFEQPGTYCVFGHNGSGKSTFFKLLSGSLDPTAGMIKINGKVFTPDCTEQKTQIGYLPQDLNLPSWATAIDLLRYAAGLNKEKISEESIEATLRRWDCLDFSRRPIATYSHGMQKRIGLSLISLAEPDFLILDEPFSGLDFLHISTLKKWIKARNAGKYLTILSTHIVPFAAELSDQVIFIANGKIRKLDKWDSNLNLGEKISIFEKNIALQET